MDRVLITKSFLNIITMQVCAVTDATDTEILDICNRDNPAGTSFGWCDVVREDDKYPRARPAQCEEHADRTHYLVRC